MATFRGIVTATPVTPEMVKEFVESYPGGVCPNGWDCGNIKRNDRVLQVNFDTGLFPLDIVEEDMETCRKALGGEPRAYIEIQVFNPRDEASFALAEDVRQAMIDRWGGLRLSEIFGEDWE